MKRKSRPEKRVESYTKDRAVAPVIGIVLVVATTVILAAVVGTFVLGITPGEEPAPNAQFSFHDATDSTITIAHNAGSPQDLGEFTLLVDSDSEAGNESMEGVLDAGERATVDWGEEQTPGDNVEVVLRHDPTDSIVATDTVVIADD